MTNSTNERPHGLYVAAQYSEDSRAKLAEYLFSHNVPNPVAQTSFHTTIVYSKAPVEFTENHSTNIWVRTTNSSFTCWDTKDGKCLVLKIFSPYLLVRFNEAMKAGASYDFPEYQPHITLSYDIQDWDWSKLPPLGFDLSIIGEYAEPIELEDEKVE